jgi:hypothetical protein
MITQITEEEFEAELASFRGSAFRLETRDAYALGYERADFEAFLAGNPVPPPEVGWWRPWLEQVAALTRDGRLIGRVRLVADPPTPYQQWELWAARWHAQAGEDIRYLPRLRAEAVGLPADEDWWLLDDERLIICRFTDTGEIESKTLITDAGIVATHRQWRDLAVRNATPAEEIAAA